ncbi:MAG: hypothetical protein Q4P13_12015, partial [Psychrobacter sp.]|nr:hypothetical protein [Psychrobacter sp.]
WLENLVSPVTQISAMDQAEANTGDISPISLRWHYLLTDLKTVVLPEFYVVFHDATTAPIGRRRLYDMTQAIYFALERYRVGVSRQADARAVLKSATSSHEHYLNQAQSSIDNYVTGQGVNAQLAAQLLSLAQYIEVDGAAYIARFEPYYTLLIELDQLDSYLKQHSQLQIEQQLQDWLQRRYTAFKIIDYQANEPQILGSQASIVKDKLQNNNLAHPLAVWAKQALSSPSGDMILSKTGQSLPLSPQTNQLILKPEQLKGGAVLSIVGVGITIAALNIPFMTIFSLLGIMFAFTGIKRIVPALNLDDPEDKLKSYSTQAMFLSFVAIIMGTVFTPAAIYTLVLALGVKVARNSQRMLRSQEQLSLPHTQSQSLGEIETTRLSKASDSVQSGGPLKPLLLDQHAHHLSLLLSEAPTERLQQLLAATNELADHVPYLRSAYPYLATRVEELIKDLTNNTILRLDELASRFVQDGHINPKAQAVFLRQHEVRIEALLAVNLKQVQDLNDTILEKQMAVFDMVGSADEQAFRDKIMELKILLRWLIAQQPDELQATSHQVILDNLETSTLNQMQTVFFDNQTSSEQKQALLGQVETLINHFKKQSLFAFESDRDTNRDKGQTLPTQQPVNLEQLLQLSSPVAAGQPTESEFQTQQFVELNEQYVRQLVKHWQ